MRKAIYILGEGILERVYGPDEQRDIAGSMDNECRRMGRFMVDELRRYLNGEPLQWQITREKAETLA